MRNGLQVGICLVGLLAGGCASALREPPPLAELGGTTSEADEASSVDRLIEKARAAFQMRPDPASVEAARALYLRAARADEGRFEALLGASITTAWLVEHEKKSGRRQELAVEGVQIAQRCADREPSPVECRYRLALAVGQQAREKPSTAMDGLDVMVELLGGVIDEAPRLDAGGPHRVLALVLVRAPGWPDGPGDPETGIDHARKAVELSPEHPANHLVLGEALIENGFQAEARAAFERAVALAATRHAAGDPDAGAWRSEAEEFLAGLH